MIISVLVGAPFAGWLRSRAYGMAERLAARVRQQGDDVSGAASSRKIIDGYLIRVVRTGRRCTANIVDLYTRFLMIDEGRGFKGGPRCLYMPQYEPGEQEAERRMAEEFSALRARFAGAISDNYVLEGGEDNYKLLNEKPYLWAGYHSGVNEVPGAIGMGGVVALHPSQEPANVTGPGITDATLAYAVATLTGKDSGVAVRISEEWIRQNCNGSGLLHRTYNDRPIRGREMLLLPQYPRVYSLYCSKAGDSPVHRKSLAKDGYLVVVMTTSLSSLPDMAMDPVMDMTQDCGLQGFSIVRLSCDERSTQEDIDKAGGALRRVTPDWVHNFRFDDPGSPLLQAEQWLDNWYWYARDIESSPFTQRPGQFGGWCQNIIESMRVSFDEELGEAVVFFVALIGRQELMDDGAQRMCHQRAVASVRISGLRDETPTAHPVQVISTDIAAGTGSGLPSLYGSGLVDTMYFPILAGAEHVEEGHRAIVYEYLFERREIEVYVNRRMGEEAPVSVEYIYTEDVSQIVICSEDSVLMRQTAAELGATIHEPVAMYWRPRRLWTGSAMSHTTRVADNKIVAGGVSHLGPQSMGLITYDAAENSLQYVPASGDGWGLLEATPGAPTCPQRERMSDDGEEVIQPYAVVLSYPGGSRMTVDGGQTWFSVSAEGSRQGLYYLGPVAGARYYTQIIGETPHV